MKTTYFAGFGLLAALLSSGCSWQLQEIKGKTKFGPEFRDKSGQTSEVRWTTIDQGFEFKWDNGWSTGVSYRRRDTDEGSGGNDNRVMFEVSYPLWRATARVDATEQRVKELERRLAILETGRIGQESDRLASRLRDTNNTGHNVERVSAKP